MAPKSEFRAGPQAEQPSPRSRRAALLAVAAIVLSAPVLHAGVMRAAFASVTAFLAIQGPSRPVSANVLSEHEIEVLDTMSPQSQAVLLLERSINHFRGANEQIARRANGWLGQLKLEGRLHDLFTTALNSDDLRVRVAAVEVDLAARNVQRTSATVDRLEPAAREAAQGPRANALWDLALLGNRGIEPDRIRLILMGSIHDPNVNIRYWAVEGLAYLAVDEVVPPLLDVLRHDPSGMIRERAACGLSQSGMLSDRQRRTAVPRLLDYADDGGMDQQTHEWVFQALRDITGQTLPHDAQAWRNWYRLSGGAHP
jgi:HEAT repeat protein